MRRYFTLMVSHFGFARVAFEDVLCEMGSLYSVGRQLHNSRTNAIEVIAIANTLENEMGKFRDLLTLCTIDLDALGKDLTKHGIVNAKAWQRVAENARFGGFRKNLALIRSMTILAVGRIDYVSEKLQWLRENKGDFTVKEISEMNLLGNPEVVFAQLQTLLTNSQEIFHAAWILSTEVYHHFHGNEPLR